MNTVATIAMPDLFNGVLIISGTPTSRARVADSLDLGREKEILDADSVSGEDLIAAAARFRSRGVQLVVTASSIHQIPYDALRNLDVHLTAPRSD